MRLRSVFKISLFLCAVFAAIALTFRFDNKLFAIEKIQVSWAPSAEEYCSEQRLLCQSLLSNLNENLKSIANKKIWQVDISALRTELMQNNWFKMVSVTRRYPNEMSFIVDLEHPVALLANGNEILAVAEEGQLLEPVKISYLPSLPILRGENFTRSLVLRKMASDFLHDISSNSELSIHTIAEMTYSKEENFSLLILPSKSIVKMNSDHVTLKAARVAQVIEYLNSNQMNGRVIDARFSKKVLVRLRKGS